MTGVVPRPPVRPAPPWVGPRPFIHRLDNGVTVWAYDLPGQYVCCTTLVLELPINAEAIDGVGWITARCLDEGTLAHPGVSFTEALEGVGGQVHALVGQSTTQCTLDVPVSRFAQALPLLAEAVISPELADDKVIRLRDTRLTEIEHEASIGGIVANRALRQTLLDPATRLTRPIGGNADTVARLTPTDARTHHRLYGPQDATLIVAGDLRGTDVVRLAEETFGGWAATPAIAAPDTPTPGPGGRVTIARPGAVQVDVRLGWLGIDRTDHRWPALQLGLAIMGGTFQSRLNTRLREELGWTYGVSMGASPFRVGGLIQAGCATRTDAADDLVSEALDLTALHDPFTSAELESAAGYLIGSTPMSLDTAEAVVGQAASLAASRLPLDYLDRLLAALATVTPEQATAAYRDLIDPAAATLVLVGDL